MAHPDDLNDPDFPVYRHYRGQPVPHLGRMDRDDWKRALAPLSDAARRAAVESVGSPEEASRAFALIGELDLEDVVPRLDGPPRLPRPQPTGAGPRAGRQVNVRLRNGDFGALCRAAELVDVSPTQLARVFIINGSQQLLRECRRE